MTDSYENIETRLELTVQDILTVRKKREYLIIIKKT